MELEEIKHVLETCIEQEENGDQNDRFTLGMIHGLSFALSLISGDEDAIKQVREAMK